MTIYTLSSDQGPLGRYTITGPLEVVPRGLRSSFRTQEEAEAASRFAALKFGWVAVVEETL